jgi:NADH-quinone oxidoreductase subunit L
MGGLRKRIPVTYWTMTIGVVAIAGIPPLAAFFSKDEILFRTFEANKLLWLVGLVTAGMTSFYMFRLWFKTFWGEERFEEHHDAHQGDHAHGVHESPLVMTVPLMILALLSIIGGWVGIPAAMGGHDEIGAFLEPVFANGAPAAEAASHSTELGLAAISVLVALIGFYVAYLFYYKKPGTATSYAERFPTLYRIVLNKFYIDEIYQTAIVTPLLMFTRLFLGGVVDTGLVNGSAATAGATTRGLSSLVRRIQSGNIRSYAGWLALGAAAVIFVMIFGHSILTH